MRPTVTLLALLTLFACPKGAALAPPTDSGVDDAGVDAGLPPPHDFVEVQPMHVGRISHTATLLQSGEVLVVGGATYTHAPLDSVELYSPDTRTWAELAALPQPRANHTATLLKDGRVLIAGGGRANSSGYPGSDVTGSALLFDPASKTFSPTGDMVKPRSHHVAVPLENGDVLVFGGGSGTFDRMSPYMADTIVDAEVYQAASGTWKAVGPMLQRRVFHAGARLASGAVLVVGGTDELGNSLTEAELYDPATESWRATGSLTTQDRFRHTLTVLGDGTALVAAGKRSNVAFLDTNDPSAACGNAPCGADGYCMH